MVLVSVGGPTNTDIYGIYLGSILREAGRREEDRKVSLANRRSWANAPSKGGTGHPCKGSHMALFGWDTEYRKYDQICILENNLAVT